MGAILLMLLTAPLVGGASPGQRVWPPSGYTHLRDVADLGRDILDDNASEPIALGPDPVVRFDIHRLNSTASRLVIQEEGRPSRTFVQRHVPVGNGSTLSLGLRPQDLHPLIEVPGNGGVLQVIGPPGSFDINRSTRERQALAFGEKAGLPAPPDRSKQEEMGWQAWAHAQWRLTDDHGPLLLPFQGNVACVRGSDGACDRDATFRLECPNCTSLVREIPPVPDRELSTGEGPRVVSSYNRARVVFDEHEHLIAAQVSLAVDVDPSALMPPKDSAERAAGFLEDRGYRYDNRTAFREAKLRVPIQGGSLEPKTVLYVWHLPVGQSNTSDPGKAPLDMDVTLVQDAQTGQVTRAEFGSRIAEIPPRDDPGTQDEADSTGRPLPAAGPAAVVGAAVAAWVWTRLRHRL